MLARLSLRNASRQIKNYIIYFTTIIIAATLIYAFNALAFSKEIRDLSNILNSLPIMIGISSLVVAAIIGWLVYYVMRFIMLRRSRELATYILLGVERKKIVRMLFLENILIGVAGVLLGLISGNLLFQILRAVLLKIFEINYNFSFCFSLEAAVLTIICFMGIYLVALILNQRKIKKSKICELIKLDERNEQEFITESKNRRKLFTASIISGVSGVGLLITFNTVLSLIGSFLIIFFLFAFYISFSSGVPAFYNKNIKRKYTGNTLGVFRLLCSKVGKMGITMSILSMLLTANLIAIGTGLAFNHFFERNIKIQTEHNLFISSYDIESGFDDYKDYISKNIDVTKEFEYKIYRLDNDNLTIYITPHRNGFKAFDYDMVMAYSDYAELRRMDGYEEVLLQDGKYILHCLDYLAEPFKKCNEPVKVASEILSKGEVRNEVFTQQLWDGNGGGFIIVVADDIAKSLPVSHIAYAAKTGEDINYSEEYLALVEIRENLRAKGGKTGMIYSREVIKEEYNSLYVMIVLPLFYVALVLLTVSATILAVQILSELSDYKIMFGILHTLGAEKEYMISALRKQFAVYYLLPTFPAVIISAIFLFFLCKEFDPGVITGTAQIWGIVGTTIGLFFAIYALYIGISYISLKRSVIPY